MGEWRRRREEGEGLDMGEGEGEESRVHDPSSSTWHPIDTRWTTAKRPHLSAALSSLLALYLDLSPSFISPFYPCLLPGVCAYDLPYIFPPKQTDRAAIYLTLPSSTMFLYRLAFALRLQVAASLLLMFKIFRSSHFNVKYSVPSTVLYLIIKGKAHPLPLHWWRQQRYTDAYIFPLNQLILDCISPNLKYSSILWPLFFTHLCDLCFLSA